MQETKAGESWLPVASFHFPKQAWEVRAPLRGLYRIIHDPEARTWAVFRDSGAGVTDKLGSGTRVVERRKVGRADGRQPV